MYGKIEYKKIKCFAGIAFFVASLFLVNSSTYAVSSLQINFSGKIVTNAGLDISESEPACIVAEGADTCDFKIMFYDHVSADPGTLLGEEVFADVELGDYRGHFNLKIGNGAFTSGEHSSIKEIFLNEEDVYVEILFDASGGVPDFNHETNTDLETFVVSQDPLERMLIGASPYAISARGALDEFQLTVKESATGTTKGLVYFDGGDNFMKVHDGTEWKSLSYLLWEEDVSNNIFFNTGTVGIGTVTPNDFYDFHVDGTSLFDGDVTVGSSGLETFTVDGNSSFGGEVHITEALASGVSAGAVHIDSSGKLIHDSSSEKYKDNIKSHGSVLSALANLELVDFTWNKATDSPGQEDVGMIAEEVAKYIPELVRYNSFGQTEGLKYDRMGAYAIAGLGELKEEFDRFKDSLEEEEPDVEIYTSEEELEVGSLVSRDFSGEDLIVPFENNHVSLYGIVSEIIHDEEIVGYTLTPYKGIGEYEVLVHRGDESEGVYENSGLSLYMDSTGRISLLEEDDEFSMHIGYTLEPIEFEETSYSELSSIYLNYTPIKFGSQSMSLSSLFSNSISDSLTFGGGHINFKGNRGEFTILETKMLTVTEQLLIYGDDDSSIEIVRGDDSYHLLEKISELEERLNELEGGVEEVEAP